MNPVIDEIYSTYKKRFYRLLFCLFLGSCRFIYALSGTTPVIDQGHSLVYIHIGDQFPKHLPDALTQARLFNPDTPIFLIGYDKAFSEIAIATYGVVPISIESLEMSENHKKYKTETKMGGFWRYTLERFLFLDDFIQQYGLQNVFHVENDVMLYFNLSRQLPIFQQYYSNMMASVFDCDQRCVPSFVYIANPATSELLSLFIAERAHLDTTDMELLSLFKDAFYKTRGDHLPILIPSYANDYPLTNIFKNTALSATPYSNHLEEFQMIFDAAALGQFLGGIDPILGESKPGFMGEASVFLPMYFAFTWIKDEEDRWIPYISYKDQIYPIANLHIHSKALYRFSSLNTYPPVVPAYCFSSLPFDHIHPLKK